MSDDLTRPIWQIVVKTVVTYAVGILVYNQYNTLVNAPTRHNARLFRLIAFAIAPTTILGQLLFDAVKAVIRALQCSDEFNLNNTSAKHLIKFYWDGILGVRSTPAPEVESDQQEANRLLDLHSSADVHAEKPKWTGRHTIRLLVSLLGVVHSTVLVVLFVRRTIHRVCERVEVPCRGHSSWCDGPTYSYISCYHSTNGWDVRNIWMAGAELVVSILSLYLVLAGNVWTPSLSLPAENLGQEDASLSTNISSSMGELKRVVIDFALGAAFQEWIAVETYFHSDGAPVYVTNLMYSLHRTRISALEAILLALLALMLVMFRAEIAHKLGIKTGIIRLICWALVAVVAVWLLVDAVGVDVTDIAHFATGHYGNEWNKGEMWMDVVEKWVPII